HGVANTDHMQPAPAWPAAEQLRHGPARLALLRGHNVQPGLVGVLQKLAQGLDGMRVARLALPGFDARADALARRDQALMAQMLDRLAHRVARHAERLAELSLRRQQPAD